MRVNNTFKRIMFILITVFMLNFTVISIYAESKNIDANLYSNVSTLVETQELQVTLSLKQNTSKGLNAYKAKLVYDKEVFESVSKNNFLSLNDWEMLEFNEKTGEFVAIKKSGSIKAEEVVKIRLKTKNNIKSGKSTVKIKEIVTSDGKKDLFVNDENVTIDLVGSNQSESIEPKPIDVTKLTESTTLGEQTASKNGVSINNENNINSVEDVVDTDDVKETENSSKIKSDKKSSSLEDENISKINKKYIFIFLIIFIGINFLIFFILKDDDKNDKKKTHRILMFVLIGVLSLHFISTVKAAFYDFSKKGEVNGDNKVTYEDVKCLENHLINNKKIENIYLENADMNSDDLITVTDLTLLVQKLEKTLDYEVNLSTLEQESKFFSKDKDISLSFMADVSYGAKIKKVKINDIYYDAVEDSLERGKYKVVVQGSTKAGIKDYNFTEVLLNNDKKIKVDLTESVEILKANPIIKNYNVSEDFSNSIMNISFDLVDEDSSVTTSKISIIDELGKIVKETEIEEGYNTIKVKVVEGKVYKAKFLVNYNLTGDKDLIDITGNLVGNINFEKELQLVIDYKFNAGNFVTTDTTFGRGEDIKIFFDSTNVTKYVPERINVNGKNYNVFLENNKYTAIISGFNDFGKNIINIESITLNNGKTFELKDKNKLTVNIIKSAPSISDFVLEENAEKDVVDVKFKVNNNDNSLLDLVINLTDDNDILLEQIKLDKKDLNGTKIIKNSLKNASQVSNYKVSVLASYNQTEKDEDIKENVILFKQEFTVVFKAKVKESSSNKSYYEKGEDVLLTYNIVTNSSKNITKIRINNRDYSVKRLDDGGYRVVYKAFTKSGIETINTTKVICEDGTIADIFDTRKIEVLKDAPKISDFKQNVDTKNSKVTLSFYLDDSDSSFVSGKANLTNNSDGTVVTKEIKNGKNSLEFDVKNLKTYILNVNVTYNRDSNNDSINKVVNQTILTKEISGSSDYKLVINNIKTTKDNKETKYFEKNEVINIDFESTNVGNYDISEVTINGNKYAVSKVGNTYRVALTGYSKAGNQTLTIEKVKLSNSREIEVNSNNKVQIEVLKDAPKIGNFKQIDDEKNYRTTISFDLDDSDSSLIFGEAVLINKNDASVVRKELKKGKNNLEFNIQALNTYTLNINVTYDRDSKEDSINKFTNQTILTREISGSSDYKLVINNIKTTKDNKETKYFEKNEVINIDFESTNVGNYNISEVTINGNKYAVSKLGNTYRVVLTGYSKAGNQTLTIEKVKLSNSKEIEVNSNNKVQIEVLKSKPVINNYKVIEDINDSNLTISFDIVDPDNSIVDSSVKFVDANNEVIKTVTPKKGNNTVKLSVEDGKKYKAKFDIKYNLTSEDKPTDTSVVGTISQEKELQLNINYNFVADNFKTYNDKNEETILFNKGQDIKIMFTSSNATIHEVSKIKINGKDYDVKKENNIYVVNILGIDRAGLKTFNIDEVTLDNGKVFEVKKILSINVIKDIPIVSNLNLVENTNNDQVNANFTINDDDKALLGITVKLFDDKGNILEEIQLTDKEITDAGEISKVFKRSFVSKYKVSVIGSYSQTDNTVDIKNVVLSEKEIEAIARADIIELAPDKIYYEKDSNVDLTYSINTNKSDEITKITINNKDYTAQKLSNGKYQVVYKNDTISGVKTLKTTKLTYSNGQSASVNTTVKIEVLKSAPRLANLKQNDDIENGKVIYSFDILDDDSFLNGKAIVTKVEDDTICEFDIKKGHNEIEIPVEYQTPYKANIFISYDLDTNELTDNANKYENVVFKELDIILLSDYEFTLTNVNSYKNQVEAKDFLKDETIVIGFDSSNVTNFEPTSVKINGKIYGNIEKINNRYYVAIDNFDEFGTHKVNVEEVILSNGKYFTLTENNSVSVNVLRRKPSLSNFSYVENVKDDNINLKFNLKDDDNALNALEIILLDDNNKEISKTILSKEELKTSEVSKTLATSMSEKYKVKVNVTYKKNQESIKEVLLEQEIMAQVRATIKYVKSNKKNYTKNENIILTYQIQTNQKSNISKIMVNGVEYPVTKLENGNYQIIIKGPLTSGEFTLKTTKVVFENNLDKEVSNTLNLEVLKSQPTIINERVDQDDINSQIIYSFDVLDEEDAFLDGKVTVTKLEDNTTQDFDVQKGHNVITIPVDDGKKYKANILIKYNLSNGETEEFKDKLNVEKELLLNIDYQLKVTDIAAYNDDTVTNEFSKGEQIKISFESTNATIFEPTSVKINGKVCKDLEIIGSRYYATIEGFDNYGTYNIKIEELTLSNGKSLTLTEDNEISINVVQKKPSLSDFSYNENVKDESIDLNFKLKDEDSTLTALDIILLDGEENEISKTSLTKEELKLSNISKKLSTIMSSKYKIRIKGIYKRIDEDKEIILYEKEISAKAKAKIKSVMTNKTYFAKKEVINVVYDIESNRNDLSKIVVNNSEYSPTKLENGNYQITLKAPSKSGIVDLKTTKIVFNNNEEISLTNTKKIEVLKNVPTVVFGNNIEDIENSKITHSFEIVDEDNSFISGKVVVTKLEDNTIREFNIKKGFNELEIPVEYMKEYMAAVYVTYDLDTDELTKNDNKYENVKLSEHSLELNSSYELNVDNIKTYNKNEETKYFSKDEAITVRFESSNNTRFKPVQAVIVGKTYDVTEVDGKYETQITGYSEVGVKTIKLEKIILENTHEEELKDTFKVEILKDKPTASNYAYEEKTSGDISVKFSVSDSEKTITSGKIFILEDNTTLKEQALVVGNNTITFTPKSEKSYFVKVVADYDLDSNKLGTGFNEYQNVILLENEINLGRRQFQVKDIVSTSVYTQTSEGVKELDNVNISSLTNLDNFIVKVNSKDMPSFYTTIESYRVVDNRLKLTLKYDDIVQYVGNKKLNKLEVDVGKVNNGIVIDDSLDALIKRINANPNGNFELTKDYDASLVSPNLSTIVTEKFTGTLNGNGHKITNLSKSLFNELEGATIKNIVFSNVELSGASSRGTIANVATDSTVTNVHIKGLNYTTGANHSAGMIGEATNTNVSECSVTDFIITTSGHVRVSAIIGKLTDGSIRNCYAEGDINSTQSKDGNGIGGVLGHGYGVETVENCITKIKITNNQGARLNGAVVGLFMNKASVLKNNVSLSTGQNFYSVYGNGGTVTATNNYELEDSGLVSNELVGKYSSVSKNKVNSNFFKNEAKFDETIWDLSDVSYNKLPTLKNADPNGSSNDDEITNRNIYIPDYNRLRNISGYKKSNEKLYHNIYKLMPYYDAKFLVEDSTKIASDNVLATKVIKHILPYSDGKLLTYITAENYNTISYIKVIFDDMSVSSYKVNFKELNQNISIYDIEGLGIDYAPDSYLIKNDSSIVNTLKTYIEGIDYNTTLEPLTEAADARHYRDNFNEVIKGLSLELSLKLLANYGDAITINSEILNNKIKADLIDSGKVNTYIYGYNYFNRWYDFEIGGSKISDLLLFENKMFKEENTFDHIVNEVLVGNLAVNSTDGFFNSNVAKYTGSSRLQYFLDYLITNIGGYEDVNDWFTEYFGARNFLTEFGVDNRPEILYRGWYHLKMMSRMILPVITMPRDSTYMISGPAHLQFGPAQLYNKDTVTDAGKKVVRSVINNHVTLAKRHFTVLAGGFGSLKWNNYCIMVYDCTKIITGYKQGSISVGGITIPTGKIVPVYTQGRVGSNYAFFKNFSEVLGLWQPAGSSGGVGSTAGYLWFQAQPGLTNFDTWTHEFEHALSDKIMLDQRGFRTRMEVMTQGNVEQRDDWSENNLSQDVGPGYFNTSFYLNKEGNATQNLSPDRIDTKEEMENYFKGQQNALDLLDYIEGKAFIRLTPEQQAKIATKVTSASERTAWGTITTDQATQMNLTSLESLYDNQIILRPLNAWGASVRGLTAPASTIADNYGYESVWVNRWYIDHYDSHFAGAFGTKRNFFEMLGYAGVEGYIIYGSGSRSAIGDLNVIQRITKLVTGTAMNWREYKMSRYATVEENLNNNKYIDAEYMIQRFTEALVNDANNGDRNVSQRTNLRKIYYHYLKSATNDFIDDPLGSTVEVNHIKTAEELVQKINAQPYGYYVLDNDIDFSNMTKNVTQTFMGRLDGNGHKIIGNKFPIFNKIRYGYVGNIVFENTDIPKTVSNAGALSYRSEMSTIEKISAKNIQMNFAGRNDLSLIGGAVSNVVTRDCNVEKLTHHISSIEDIAMLNEDTSGIFIIDNDIDFAGKTYNGAIVSNTFTGKIDGNGHTFSNLTNASLFANFNGTVENLNINNFSIQSTDSNIGSFAKQTSGATLRNMNFTNITINGASNLGAVVGTDNRGSVFERISVKNFSSTSTGMFVGGIAGSQYGGRVSNVIVEGEISIAHIGAGGIIGATGNGTAVNINNAISNVKINRTGDTDTQHRKNNAGVVGFIADISKLASITNSVALGDMLGFTEDMLPNKFVYTTESVITTKLIKCYELAEASGLSSVNSNTTGHLDVVNRDNLTIDFYKNLGFDETIWNLDTVSSKGYPALK